MKLLTEFPIVDRLQFRYNFEDHNYFSDLFQALQRRWWDIPEKNYPRQNFIVRNAHPNNSHLWLADRTIDDVLDVEEASTMPQSLADHELWGSLSKDGEKFWQTYLLVVPGFGRLYVHRKCLVFTVENRLLLEAQTQQNGLNQLIWRVYKKLWHTLGLWFFINEFDLALDIDADPGLLADLRRVETRKHFLLAGPLRRHTSVTFYDSETTDENGVAFGTRKSRFSIYAYDRNKHLENASAAHISRLRSSRKFLTGKIYRYQPKAHEVRLEVRFRDLIIYPSSGVRGRAKIFSAYDLPSKQNWRHDRTYQRVYWDQLDLVVLFREVLEGLQLLQSDLKPHIRYGKLPRVLAFSAAHIRKGNLRRIRDKDPVRWDQMRHPYQKFLLGELQRMTRKNRKIRESG